MKKLLASGALAALSVFATPAQAGVYGDDLSRCLVSSTSDADKTLLVRWIFSALALNKEIASFVDMPAEVRGRINADTAALYMRLLTDSCRTQTHDAFKYEGQAAINGAFQLLGQVASQGIFSDPMVEQGMTEMTSLLDTDKLKAVIEEK